MGCCGESIDQPTDQEKKTLNGNGALMNQQPTQIPQMSDKMFQQPQIPSPPPIQQLGMQGTGNFQQQQMQPQWMQQPSQSPPPNMNQFNPYALAASTSPGAMGNQFTGTTLNGMAPNGGMNGVVNGLQRPSPVHPASPFQTNNAMMGAGIPPQSRTSAMPMEYNSPPVDEGKMSISIDFGECKHISCLCIQNG
jgi:hypothetical protein